MNGGAATHSRGCIMEGKWKGAPAPRMVLAPRLLHPAARRPGTQGCPGVHCPRCNVVTRPFGYHWLLLKLQRGLQLRGTSAAGCVQCQGGRDPQSFSVFGSGRRWATVGVPAEAAWVSTYRGGHDSASLL